MKWILVTDVLAVVETDLKNAWLFPHTKNAEKKTKELIKIDNRERRAVVDIIENKFEVEIKDGKVFIALKINESKNPEFYLIKNFDNTLLLELLEVCDTKQGVFLDLLELGYNCEDEESDKIALFHEKMKSYDEAVTEMVRKSFCTKKTKKRVVGHRYDSKELTLVYLGEIYVNEFEENVDLAPMHLYTKDSKKCTKLSEILKTQRMGYEGTLIALPADKVQPLIDCGKVLENDVELSDEWIVELVRNGKNIIDKITPLCYKVSPDDKTVKLPEEIRTGIVKDLFEIGLKTYITRRSVVNYVEGEDDPDSAMLRNLKVEVCINLCTDYLLVETLSIDFYDELFKSIGINMDEVLTEVLKFDVESVLNNFELYKKYSDCYFKQVYPTVDLITYLKLATNKDISLTKQIDLCLDSDSNIPKKDIREAAEMIKNFIITVNDTRNLSKLVPHYHRYNEGTATKPSYFTQMKFNMSDVIKWAEENQLITDNIKYFILESKLRNFYMEFKDSTNIKL